MSAIALANETASALMRALTGVWIEEVEAHNGIAYVSVHWHDDTYELRIEEVTV